MDPAITRPVSVIGSACQALISTVHQVSADVTNFVRRCRSTRTDLAPVMRELSELQMVLQLLNDFEAQSDAVPEELQVHLRPIMTNCIGLVAKVHRVLQRQEVAGWTVEARDEVSQLAKSLGVHRGVMGVVADLISILASRRTGDSDDDDGGIDDEHFEITGLVEELKALGSSLVISYSNASLAREHFALQVHLGQIITYAETLARTDPWQDAVRTLDEAQRVEAGLDQQQPDVVRRSVSPLPALMERGHSVDRTVAAARVRNSGLENLLPLGPPPRSGGKDEGNRQSSILFTLNREPESTPPLATIESAESSGTGFIEMDGFNNSAQGGAATSPSVPYYGELEQRSTQHLAVPGSETRSSWRSYLHRKSAELAVTRPILQNSQPKRDTVRASASGLQLQIPDEKELAVDDIVSDEALAFAQVPIHVLDRLSVNLVGHVYGGSPSSTTGDKASGSQSHSTARTSKDEDAWDRTDAASTNTSDIGGLGGGSLQSSQIDVSKVSPAGAPASHFNCSPNPNQQPPSGFETPIGHQQQQQLIPASQPLSDIASNPASQAAPQATDEVTTTDNSRPSFNITHSSLNLAPASHNGSPPSTGGGSLREMKSISTIKTVNTQTYIMSQKPLPRAPLVFIPDYPGPFIKKKVVVVGNFSCGKTCLITRMARGQYPRSKADELRITETVKLSVDEAPIQLCFWDIRGIDYDPSWLHDAHVALVCFSVNIGSTDSKGKHLGRWVAEVNRNCAGAAILLVGLKSDIRFHAKSVEKLARAGKALVTPEQGDQFRENIGASRYVECSARTGEGVQDVLAETARVALQVGGVGRRHARKSSGGVGGRRPLSRIGKFFGLGQGDG